MTQKNVLHAPDFTAHLKKYWINNPTLIIPSFAMALPVDLAESLELIANGTINVKDMISHSVRLADVQKGFDIAGEAQDSLKVIVTPDWNPKGIEEGA